MALWNSSKCILCTFAGQFNFYINDFDYNTLAEFVNGTATWSFFGVGKKINLQQERHLIPGTYVIVSGYAYDFVEKGNTVGFNYGKINVYHITGTSPAVVANDGIHLEIFKIHVAFEVLIASEIFSTTTSTGYQDFSFGGVVTVASICYYAVVFGKIKIV